MTETDLLTRLRTLKTERTYQQLSRQLDMPVSTIARWLKTGRINKVYAGVIQQRLKNDR